MLFPGLGVRKNEETHRVAADGAEGSGSPINQKLRLKKRK
jgi:hypothetical protein